MNNGKPARSPRDVSAAVSTILVSTFNIHRSITKEQSKFSILYCALLLVHMICCTQTHIVMTPMPYSRLNERVLGERESEQGSELLETSSKEEKECKILQHKEHAQ